MNKKDLVTIVKREAPVVKEKATELALHAGAFVWSTMAGITGDYASLGGYQGIYHRLEMGLAKLRSK